MKSNRRNGAFKPSEENEESGHLRTHSSGAVIEDVSGDNWDAEVIALLLRDGESNESVIRADTPPPDNVKENDLSRANLTGANLSKAHLNGAELILAQLSHAELRGAHLAGAHLSYANLTGADLKDVDLNRADLSFADLTSADLRGASLFKTNLENADLRGADLRSARLGTARVTRAKLPGAIFDEATELPFDREEALELGMVLISQDAAPDVEVVSGKIDIADEPASAPSIDMKEED